MPLCCKSISKRITFGVSSISTTAAPGFIASRCIVTPMHIIASVLILAAAAFSFSSCSLRPKKGTAKNDILSMKEIAQDKLLITVRTEANINDTHFEEAIEKQFPSVDIVFRNHIAPETMYEFRQSLSSDDFEDIVISPHFQIVSDIVADHLLDLSGETFTANYNPNSLNACSLNGKLYYLPGPSDMYGIIYDKTLFAEHGWQVPKSYSEFIALCKTIDGAHIRAADGTILRAMQPTCRYARQSQLMFTIFCYDDYLGGLQNYEWLSKYQEGSARMKDHLLSAFDKYRELNANNIITASDFDMQPGNRSDMMYTKHSVAMIIENNLAETYGKTYPVLPGQTIHEYGMMPFWCGDTADSDHLLSYANYYIGVNKALADKKNASKLAAVRGILSYISTPQGQLAIAGGKLTMVSSVTGTPMEATPFNSEIQATIAKGNAIPEPNLMKSGNNNPAEKALQAGLRAFLENKMTAEAVCDSCDAARDKSLALGIERGAVVATATASFTRMETAEVVADALRAKAGTDIALCLVDKLHCGLLNRIYKGDITEKDIATLSLSNGPTNGTPGDQKLWMITITGATLKEMLSMPYAADIASDQRFISYFVPSGLKIEFAPWAPVEDKLRSVTLSDGTALDDAKEYKVALWGWPLTQDIPYSSSVIYDYKIDEILSEYIAAQKTLTPLNDKRMTLVWKVTADKK